MISYSYATYNNGETLCSATINNTGYLVPSTRYQIPVVPDTTVGSPHNRILDATEARWGFNPKLLAFLDADIYTDTDIDTRC